MKSTGCILLGIFLSASVIFAEDNGNYLNYSIPVDAIKVGPQGMRDPEKQEYL